MCTEGEYLFHPQQGLQVPPNLHQVGQPVCSLKGKTGGEKLLSRPGAECTVTTTGTQRTSIFSSTPQSFLTVPVSLLSLCVCLLLSWLSQSEPGVWTSHQAFCLVSHNEPLFSYSLFGLASNLWPTNWQSYICLLSSLESSSHFTPRPLPQFTVFRRVQQMPELVMITC